MSVTTCPEQQPSTDILQVPPDVDNESLPGTAKSNSDAPSDPVDAPKGLRFALLFTCILLSMFFVGYDTSCIATLVPVITDEFNALKDFGWYTVAYLLTQSATLLIYGQLYTFYSMKKLFITSQAVFVAGSILSAAAPTSPAFIVGRAVSGWGVAGMLAGTTIITANTTSLKHRPVYFAVTGAVETAALAFGPLISGTIAHYTSWRVSFYVMIPFGVLTILIFLFAVGDIRRTTNETQRSEGRLKSIDWAGFAANVPMALCLVLALQWGGNLYEWSNWRVVLLLVLAGVLLTSFLLLEHRAGDASLVPLKMLCQRTVACASLITFCNFAHLCLLAYYLPFYFQAVRGASTIASGIMYLPTAISLGIASLAGGQITKSLGYYSITLMIGCTLMTVGAGLITTFTPDTTPKLWISYQVIYGMGIGLTFQPPFIGVQTVLPDSMVPRALVMLSFAQMFGGIVILSIAQNVFLSRLATNLATSVPGMDSTAILSKGALGIVGAVPEKYREQVLMAYNASLVQVFYIALGLTCVVAVSSLGIGWRSVRGQKGDGDEKNGKGAQDKAEKEEKEGRDAEKANGEVEE